MNPAAVALIAVVASLDLGGLTIAALIHRGKISGTITLNRRARASKQPGERM